MLVSVLAVALVFGLIVFVHELGHMLAAKLCGVAVPHFAFGMGPSLFSWQVGDTRYHLCALPIGGFVSIAGLDGDDPLNRPKGGQRGKPSRGKGEENGPADEAGPAVMPAYPFSATWPAKSGWQKAFILTAGVAMNFLLAFVVMLSVGFIGFPQKQVMISAVTPDGPAAEAGIQPGDIVETACGQQVSTGRHFTFLVQTHLGSPIEVELTRRGELHTVAVEPGVIEGFNEGKPSLGVGLTEIGHTTTTVSLVPPKTWGFRLPAMQRIEQAGLRNGDVIRSVNGRELSEPDELFRYFAAAGGAGSFQLLLEVERAGEQLSLIVPGDVDVDQLVRRLNPELEFEQAVDAPIATGFAAYRATGRRGLKVGDRVVGVDGVTTSTGLAVLQGLFDSSGITTDAQGLPLTEETGPVHVLEVESEAGLLAYIVPWDPTGLNMVVLFTPVLQRLPLGESLARSMRDSHEMMLGFFFSVRMLFTKEGAKSIAGPVGIVSIIGQSAQSDWHTFLQIVILITINLGLINLLPLPGLDGGRLVFVALGGIGIRIQPRREAVVHAIGMVVLFGLIILVTFTDIMAYI